ncbi:FAD-dependent oxidoreductase [Rhodococcus sp. NPDC058521]|uniref:FAD-dependent oxidoreductase n=1 Tax=Rhodococcus sp. NPDC058521 TaxID=3346536 RepID=UPI0036461712
MIDVLIVGAGPTGMACAASLARSGWNFRLVDRQDAPSSESRAAVVHSHTLEVLESIGVTPRSWSEGYQRTVSPLVTGIGCSCRSSSPLYRRSIRTR